MGFWGCSQMGKGVTKKPPPKIFLTYSTRMKLYTVTLYLKKIQKIYKSHDKPLEFYWHMRRLTLLFRCFHHHYPIVILKSFLIHLLEIIDHWQGKIFPLLIYFLQKAFLVTPLSQTLLQNISSCSTMYLLYFLIIKPSL